MVTSIALEAVKNPAEGNNMAVIAQAVVAEITRGNRETMFSLHDPLCETFNRLRAENGDPMVLGQLAMAQHILAIVGLRTAPTADIEYLRQEDVKKVLDAVSELARPTDDEVAKLTGFSLPRVKTILDQTHGMSATTTVRIGNHICNRIAPLGQQILEEEQ